MSPLCTFYKAGYCKSGDKCRYTHGTTVPEPVGVCSFYKAGNCKSGDKCRFTHGTTVSEPIAKPISICSFYKAGKCKYGDKCRFTHGTTEATITTISAPMRETWFPRARDCGTCKGYIFATGSSCTECSKILETSDIMNMSMIIDDMVAIEEVSMIMDETDANEEMALIDEMEEEYAIQLQEDFVLQLDEFECGDISEIFDEDAKNQAECPW